MSNKSSLFHLRVQLVALTNLIDEVRKRMVQEQIDFDTLMLLKELVTGAHNIGSPLELSGLTQMYNDMKNELKNGS